MRILLNATIPYGGGAVQVAVNFILNTLKYGEDEWFYALSNEVNAALISAYISLPKKNTLVVDQRPSKIIGGKKIKKEILEFEQKHCVDLVYSIGSPSYIYFKAIEVQRLTNPYIINPNKYAYYTYTFSQRFLRLLKSIYQKRALKKCHYYVTQTNNAKYNISRRLSVDQNDVFVVPNAVSEIFYNIKPTAFSNRQNNIFCLSAAYPHKNLHKVPYVIKYLKDIVKDRCHFRFIFTLDKNSVEYKNIMKLSQKLGVDKQIINLGKITQEECANIYNQSKVTFLPTYLEVFSATLIESMFMKTPIVTTNFDFNKSIAKDVAFYFDPEDWYAAAKHINYILENGVEVSPHIQSGYLLMKNFPSSLECFKMTMQILRFVFEKEINNKQQEP